jgi:hypothetical protein
MVSSVKSKSAWSAAMPRRDLTCRAEGLPLVLRGADQEANTARESHCSRSPVVPGCEYPENARTRYVPSCFPVAPESHFNHSAACPRTRNAAIEPIASGWVVAWRKMPNASVHKRMTRASAPDTARPSQDIGPGGSCRIGRSVQRRSNRLPAPACPAKQGAQCRLERTGFRALLVRRDHAYCTGASA